MEFEWDDNKVTRSLTRSVLKRLSGFLPIYCMYPYKTGWWMVKNAGKHSAEFKGKHYYWLLTP